MFTIVGCLICSNFLVAHAICPSVDFYALLTGSIGSPEIEIGELVVSGHSR